MPNYAEMENWLRSLPHPPQHIAVLTGAGISAKSGLPTFRGISAEVLPQLVGFLTKT